jgi:hypothetical protein
MLDADLDQELLADRRARAAELGAKKARQRAEAAQARAAELTGWVDALLAELDGAQRETARLERMVAERDQVRRAAEQRAHAERSLRLELQEQLERTEAHARRVRVEAAELAAAEARVRELEEQLEAHHRREQDTQWAAARARARAARPSRDPAPAPAIDPERLDAALVRLRSATHEDPAGSGERDAWLRSLLIRLTPRARKRPATSG